MARGLLIALEGIDGSGTTTQLDRVAARIEARHQRCHTTVEPSTGPVGRLIRTILTGEETVPGDALALLYAADRLDHLQREILPAIETGAIVLTDRYLLSSLAYQATDVATSWVREINREARRPDANLFLRVDAKTAADRRHERGGRPERFDNLERQRRVAAAYEAAIQQGDCGPTHIINAEAGIDAVTEQIDAVLPRLLAGAAT